LSVKKETDIFDKLILKVSNVFLYEKLIFFPVFIRESAKFGRSLHKRYQSCRYTGINRFYIRNDNAVPGVVDRRRDRASDRPVGRRDRQTAGRLPLEANRLRLAEQRHQETIPGLQAGGQPALGSGSGR